MTVATAVLTDDRRLDRGIRLHEGGRVRELPRRRDFEVRDDRGIHQVTVEPSRSGYVATCTCPDRPCPHVIAVALQMKGTVR